MLLKSPVIGHYGAMKDKTHKIQKEPEYQTSEVITW